MGARVGTQEAMATKWLISWQKLQATIASITCKQILKKEAQLKKYSRVDGLRNQPCRGQSAWKKKA